MRESVDSILAQSYSEWELLLVVDCASNDETRHIAEAYASREPRIRLITDLPRGGCVFNRNHALSLARGAFVAFLDSDDLWLPAKLERQVAFMNRVGCDLGYTGYAQMDASGKRLPNPVVPPERLNYNDLLVDNLLGCLTAMIRRSRFPDIQFVEHLHEDYILWLRLLKETEAQGIPDTLAVYRIAANSRSGNKIKAALARWRILRHFEHLPAHKAAWYFARYALRALRKHGAMPGAPSNPGTPGAAPQPSAEL